MSIGYAEALAQLDDVVSLYQLQELIKKVNVKIPNSTNSQTLLLYAGRMASNENMSDVAKMLAGNFVADGSVLVTID